MISPTIVFLGPSLRREDVPPGLDAIFYPPIAQGDLVRAISETQAATAIIIDGVFASAPAVRHKEILWALSRGVRICGAASMGALRAAELHSFGMRGYGFVYRWYRATLLADDDEVAVATMPPELGSQALSEALIDIRLTLRKACRHGIIAEPARQALEIAARELHFLDRTYAAVLQTACVLPACEEDELERLRAWITLHAHSQKRSDALGLLRHMADIQAKGPLTRGPSSPFVMTEAFAADLALAAIATPDIL